MASVREDVSPNDDDVDESQEETSPQLPSGYHRIARVEASPPSSTKRSRRTWTAIEQFEHEGYCYRLQRRPLDDAKDMPLARREEEAVALASTGLSRKEIAGSLGLAPSTIGVLLHRAAAKLNAKSHRELLASYRRRNSTLPERRTDEDDE